MAAACYTSKACRSLALLILLIYVSSCDEVAIGNGDDLDGAEKVDVAVGDAVAESDGQGEMKEGNGDTIAQERLKLFQYDPVEVGFVREIEVSPGRIVQMKTVAVKPPLFEVMNFISPEECDHFIELGEANGLKASATITSEFDKKYGVYADDGVTKMYDEAEWNTTFNEFDRNLDGWLDVEEALGCLPGLNGSELTSNQALRMYTDLDIDGDSNGRFDLKEFWVINQRNLSADILDWLTRLRNGEINLEEKRKGRHRVSDQAWIQWMNSEDYFLKELPNRLSALTKLNPQIISTSEQIQVVRYHPGGHYHAHYDSTVIDPATECIHTKMKFDNVDANHPMGRICRFITIMYYLNDVEEGGETAFPLANNETFNKEEYNKKYNSVTDLTHHCQDSNIRVRPEKGKVVMWYNHYVDKETGWIGPVDDYSLHGGCDVIKGKKWIANNWITVDDVYNRQIRFHEIYHPPPPPVTDSSQAAQEVEPSTMEAVASDAESETLSSQSRDDAGLPLDNEETEVESSHGDPTSDNSNKDEL